MTCPVPIRERKRSESLSQANEEMPTLSVPDQALHYVLLQRTAYQLPLKKHFKRVGLDKFYDRRFLRWFAALKKDEIADLYTRDIAAEYETIKDALPKDAKEILDIGCGIAGIDVFLYGHYQRTKPRLSLLDKNGISDQIYYGFRDSGACYNSLAAAEEFLVANGIPAAAIQTFDIDRDGFPTSEKFDLVVSLISWGFHYPVEVYLDQVAAQLSDGGVLILDVRKKTDGKEKLVSTFSSVETLLDERKYERLLAKK